jgi:hypothetical protein
VAERQKPTYKSRLARWEKEQEFASSKAAEFLARVAVAKERIAQIKAEVREAHEAIGGGDA